MPYFPPNITVSTKIGTSEKSGLKKLKNGSLKLATIARTIENADINAIIAIFFELFIIIFFYFKNILNFLVKIRANNISIIFLIKLYGIITGDIIDCINSAGIK